MAAATGGHSYNEVLPLMLARYCGPGLLGLGITALIAGFMSGMAGNVSAFATVWTYDIYRAADQQQGAPTIITSAWAAGCTVLGVLVSIGTAYLVMQFASIMDYVQALFSFFIAPLFGTVMLGHAVEARHRPGRLLGTAGGTLSSIGMWAWVKLDPTALRYVALSPNAKDMAENMYPRAVVVHRLRGRDRGGELVTKPVPDSELTGLVYGAPKFRRRRRPAVPAADFLGRRRGGRVLVF